MRAFVPKGWTRPIITAASKRTSEWERRVRDFASAQGWQVIADQPFRVRLVFALRRPKRMPKARRDMIVKPDLDKLTRAVLDALTGVVWHDDAQVVRLVAVKRYISTTDEEPHVDIWAASRSDN